MSDDARRCLTCMMKTCAVCGEEKRQLSFAADQWAVKDGPRRCYVCNKTRCVRCHKLKVQHDFLPGAWNRADDDPEHVCRDCISGKRKRGMWTCQNQQCTKLKLHEEFSMAKARHGDNLQGNHASATGASADVKRKTQI